MTLGTQVLCMIQLPLIKLHPTACTARRWLVSPDRIRSEGLSLHHRFRGEILYPLCLNIKDTGPGWAIKGAKDAAFLYDEAPSKQGSFTNEGKPLENSLQKGLVRPSGLQLCITMSHPVCSTAKPCRSRLSVLVSVHVLPVSSGGSELDVQGGDAELLAALSDVLCGQHGGVWGRLISVCLHLHTAGHSADRLPGNPRMTNKLDTLG